MTKAELLSQMEQHWNDFSAYLQTLTEAQWTQRTDAAGWTVKDHVMHLAIWEDGGLALLEGSSQRERKGISEEVWQRWDFDEINAMIQQRHHLRSWTEVLESFREAHRRLVAAVEKLSEADLQRLLHPDDPDSGTFIDGVVINSYAHYAEHKPWIVAIASS
jgi:uncharacterized protein (TIGR03083 family)